MTFRVTGYLRRRQPVLVQAHPKATENAPSGNVGRMQACLACGWLQDSRCQHPGASRCPGRQGGQPWRSLRRCPTGLWRA